ncbi:P-loop containing nucleoside triphosphate hydrolase protein [Agrocybe pediades]|nr:P-loop containing nucleoside triphosphate hydrolase protein [Agrocybe pediades]
MQQQRPSAAFIAAAKSTSSIPKSNGLPEIVVTGRANAGKSTLLNAVLGRTSLLSTSKKAGHTRSLNFYRVGADPGKLLLVDTPGYGARGRAEWGALFDHYIQNRKELKRIYILFNAKHGLNETDKQMVAHLSDALVTEQGTQPFTLQAIITKADTVPIANLEQVIAGMKKDIWEAAPLCLPPIVTSAEMRPPFGVDLVRQNIAQACGL